MKSKGESATRGGDIVSSLANFSNRIGIPLKNWHLPGHKYTGPFTELDKRLDENDNPLPGYEPFNQIDEIAMKHDICYRDNPDRKLCDKEMLSQLKTIKTKGVREKIDYALVKPVIWLKYKLGLGLNACAEASELHAPIRRKFKRRRVFVYNIDDIWSADLKDMQLLAKQNKHYKYILTVIDLFSKYAYAVPLKSKSGSEIVNAFQHLFKTSGRQPKKLWTDAGKEFINSDFQSFLKQNHIQLYQVYNEGKACVVERFNRTLGEMIQKHLTCTNSSKYIDVLQQMIDSYNNRYHTSIKMSPFEASDPKNADEVRENLYGHDTVDSVQKFNVGDRVRIYRYKNHFEKGYKANWTKEIFIVTDVVNTNPITYKIKDLSGENILGSFYRQELLKTLF